MLTGGPRHSWAKPEEKAGGANQDLDRKGRSWRGSSKSEKKKTHSAELLLDRGGRREEGGGSTKARGHNTKELSSSMKPIDNFTGNWV